ncbi:MAG: DrmE family protein [Clostridiaceae bacterium]|nr:DrmE family protein [Clostridiaceae bacterium]
MKAISAEEILSEDLDFLQKLTLNYEKTSYSYGPIDINILEKLIKAFEINHDKHHVILHPTSFILSMMLISTLPFYLLKSDMESAALDVTSILKKGDKVKVNGCLGEYIGIQKIDSAYVKNNEKLMIKFRDLNIYLSVEEAWKINRYDGQAIELNNYKYKPNKKISKTREIFSEIFELDEGDIPNFSKSEILIVMSKKDIMDRYININVEDIPISFIFPSAYFSSSNELFERIGPDDLQRDPKILFTSSLNTAHDLIEKRPEIKALLIHGMNKTSGNLAVLDSLIEKEQLKNIIVIDDLHRYENQDLDNLASLGLAVNVYDKEYMRKYDTENENNAKDSLGDNYLTDALKSLRYFKESDKEIKIVSDKVEENIKALYKLLDEVDKADFENDYKSAFIKRVYKIILQLRLLPVPLAFLQDNNLHNEIQDADTFLQEMRVYMYSSTDKFIFEKTDEIIEIVKKLREQHDKRHPKEEIFIDIVRNMRKKDVIVTNGGRYKTILMERMREWNVHNPIKIITLSEFMKTEQNFQMALFTGMYGAKHVKTLLKPGVKKQVMVFYNEEEKFFNYFEKNQSTYLNRKNQLLEEEGTILADEKVEEVKLEDSLFIRNFDDISYFINSGIINTENQYLGEQTRVQEAIPIEFEDDYIGFLSEGYRCRCVDYEKKAMKIKKAAELEVGDEVVFVKNSKEDIFEKIMAHLKEANTDIGKKVKTANLWRKALIKYMDENQFNFEELQVRLKNIGCERGIETIRWWLNSEDCICPSGNALESISRLTKDEELINNLQEVDIASRELKSIHIRIGRLLAFKITHSLTDIKEEQDLLLKDLEKDLSEYAQTVIVKNVYKDLVKVPAIKINRIIEKDNL